jgi:hypothetical protein
MQGICNYIPETDHVYRVRTVAAVRYLQFLLHAYYSYYYCFNLVYLRVVSSFSCIPVICPQLVLFLIRLHFVYLFCDLSKCK